MTGARHPYYKSRPIPLEVSNQIGEDHTLILGFYNLFCCLQEKDGVQTVVGKNFESVVFDDSKDVFLEVSLSLSTHPSKDLISICHLSSSSGEC